MNKILVVEDHHEFRTIVNDLLKALLPEVDVLNAANGAEGLELAQTHHPDLILLDLQMPIMDGYQMALALQQDPATKELPIVIMTNARDAGPTLVRLNQFCRGVLSKPFSLDDLSDILDKIGVNV